MTDEGASIDVDDLFGNAEIFEASGILLRTGYALLSAGRTSQRIVDGGSQCRSVVGRNV